ncbi:hypothetical protein BV898_19323, partial [Hypsibius exemplaris]
MDVKELLLDPNLILVAEYQILRDKVVATVNALQNWIENNTDGDEQAKYMTCFMEIYGTSDFAAEVDWIHQRITSNFMGSFMGDEIVQLCKSNSLAITGFVSLYSTLLCQVALANLGYIVAKHSLKTKGSEKKFSPYIIAHLGKVEEKISFILAKLEHLTEGLEIRPESNPIDLDVIKERELSTLSASSEAADNLVLQSTSVTCNVLASTSVNMLRHVDSKSQELVLLTPDQTMETKKNKTIGQFDVALASNDVASINPTYLQKSVELTFNASHVNLDPIAPIALTQQQQQHHFPDPTAHSFDDPFQGKDPFAKTRSGFDGDVKISQLEGHVSQVDELNQTLK